MPQQGTRSGGTGGTGGTGGSGTGNKGNSNKGGPLDASAPDVRALFDQDASLARWFREARSDDSGRKLANVAHSTGFSDLWYAMRLQGEHLRQEALTLLYSRDGHRMQGSRPDPRLPSAYSRYKTLIAAALTLPHLHERYPALYPPIPALHPVEATMPQQQSAYAVLRQREPARRDPVLAWLQVAGAGQPLNIVWTAQTVRIHEREMQVACAIAFYIRNIALFSENPALQPDVFALPDYAQMPLVTPLLHHFAWALLSHEVEPECPPEWGCRCAWVRAELNLRPAGHQHATDALSLQQLERTEELRRTIRAFNPSRPPSGLSGPSGGVPSSPRLAGGVPSGPISGPTAVSRTHNPSRPSVQEGPGTQQLTWPPAPPTPPAHEQGA